MSDDFRNGPWRLTSGRPPIDPEQAKLWYRQNIGPMPEPTADMDPRTELDMEIRRQEARAALKRTIRPVYEWAKFGHPDLDARTGGMAKQALRSMLWRRPKVIFQGVARAGKTSLAIACLRRRVAESGRAAGVFYAFELGVARIQHPAGRGEPELVESAMKFPVALLDDIGSEGGSAANPVADVIFARHAHDLPLWATTGLTRPQLVARYGAGIVGRLFERAVVIEMGAPVAE
jgi:hypothetical protein